jgi:hypothetical protein
MTVEDPRHMLATGQVADPVGDEWHAASYRCPCGFATDDADEFDQHLRTGEETELEHFEVLAGWTLDRVRQWQAAAVSSGGACMTVRAAGRRGAVMAGPILMARSGPFDADDRPLVVRAEVPLSAWEMVAALYREYECLAQADLSTDEDVWRHVTIVVARDGQNSIEQLTDMVAEQERCHILAAPDWLAWCRQRVADMTTDVTGVSPA